MTLLEALRQRTLHRGQTAQVPCGALGTVTVEALSPQECAALGMADGGRALFYAACRELQLAGETLRRERRLFTPDEITRYLSPGEARTAAQAVLALSGLTTEQEEENASSPEAPETAEQSAPAGEDGADADEAPSVSAPPEFAAEVTAQESAAGELPDAAPPQSDSAALPDRAQEAGPGGEAQAGEPTNGKPVGIPAPERTADDAANGGFSTAFAAPVPQRPFVPAGAAFRKANRADSAGGDAPAAQPNTPGGAALPVPALSAPTAAKTFPEAATVEREAALPEDLPALPMARRADQEAQTAMPLATPSTPETISQTGWPAAVDTAALAQQTAQALLEGLRRAAAVR